MRRDADGASVGSMVTGTREAGSIGASSDSRPSASAPPRPIATAVPASSVLEGDEEPVAVLAPAAEAAAAVAAVPSPPQSEPTPTAASSVSATQDVAPRASARGPVRVVGWICVTTRELAGLAAELRDSGEEVACSCCERRGPVVEIEVAGESPWHWAARLRRRERWGLPPPTEGGGG